VGENTKKQNSRMVAEKLSFRVEPKPFKKLNFSGVVMKEK
jgi:hypothetical protein